MELTNKVRIYKYPLPTTRGEFTLRLPKRIDILRVAVQRGQPVLYVLFRGDTDDCREQHFYCAFTGEAIPYGPDYYFIGTAILGADDDYVLHYFAVEDAIYF